MPSDIFKTPLSIRKKNMRYYYSKKGEAYRKRNKKKLLEKGRRFGIKKRRETKIKLVRLLGNKCKICKNQYPLEVYDFDHYYAYKKYSVTDLLGCSWKTVFREAKKCRLLCANCHRIDTYRMYKPVRVKHEKISRIRYHKRKKRLVKLFGGCCIDCGFEEHFSALDFDHINNKTKKFRIGYALDRRRWKDTLKEAKKCELRCANCHRIKENKRRIINHSLRKAA